MLTVATTPEQAKQVISEWKAQGLSVGLVPTMGYLHEGHESLIKRAVAENDRVMVSVFVNPIQFAPGEDLETYPRDFEADKRLIEGAGATLVFHPEPADLYFPDACTYVNVEGITAELCGKTRPTHFRGVCTVVNKLMNISQADRAYFGQKDAQQLAVIRRMVRDLNMNVQVVGCPIVREEDGLAKSSRNTYLSAEERTAALVLSRAVAEGQRLMEAGERSAATVLDAMKQLIEAEPLARIDYVEMVSWDGIKPVETVDGPILVAMAVYIGKTRLIDNFIFGDKSPGSGLGPQPNGPTPGPTPIARRFPSSRQAPRDRAKPNCTHTITSGRFCRISSPFCMPPPDFWAVFGALSRNSPIKAQVSFCRHGSSPAKPPRSSKNLRKDQPLCFPTC